MGIKTAEDLMQELGTVLQQYVSSKETDFIEVASSATRLVVTTRDAGGIDRHFKIEVHPTEETPLPPDMEAARKAEEATTESGYVDAAATEEPAEAKPEQ
jgi:hypothetical protein